MLLGGTGTGKTHLASAIPDSVICAGARGRYFDSVDLVTQLEEETRIGKAGVAASCSPRARGARRAWLSPFARSDGQLLFHLISKLYEHKSVRSTSARFLPRLATQAGPKRKKTGTTASHSFRRGCLKGIFMLHLRAAVCKCKFLKALLEERCLGAYQVTGLSLSDFTRHARRGTFGRAIRTRCAGRQGNSAI